MTWHVSIIIVGVTLLISCIMNSYGLIPIQEGLTDYSQETLDPLDTAILDIDEKFFAQNNYKRYLIFGTGKNVPDILTANSVYNIQSDNGFFHVGVFSENIASSLTSQGYNVIEDFKLDFFDDNKDASRIPQITRSEIALNMYNVTGNGTTIAIVDTGVDFSNPDIQHSLARNKTNNHPIMIDPDGQGIIFTNATFFAFIDENEIIRSYSKLPSDATSGVIVSEDGVYLDISQGGKGTTISIYNSFFPQVGSSILFNATIHDNVKIGTDNRNYIKSKSGIYHYGVMYQGGTEGSLARVQAVPVLVVDSFISGVYDTIIPDLSTSWKDYTRFDLKNGIEPNFDYDFTDEKPIVLGSGKEFLVYDSNNDGRNDYSAGTVGAQVLDVYGVIQKENNIDIINNVNAINGTLLPGLDENGNFFGVMTDFVGHGTASAASIVSRGIIKYDIYNNTEKFSIKGVAPNAKIIPVKTLWFGDSIYGWLWAAGFDSINHNWKYTGSPRVDIISNSWGISEFPSFKASPGNDILSLILSAIATPNSLHNDYPGVLIVSSAGNAGHGYGTIGLPNASPFGISVGATTNNVFVGYGQFKGEPRFGNTTTHYNDVVDFSSRGPSIIGDPKPDLMSIGAHGFVPSSVLKTEKDSRKESFSLFGGTSMAAPLVSGSAAVVMEGMRERSMDIDPFIVKNILMSTATDIHNDPFTQGSGLVDVYSAMNYINGTSGIFVVHNDKSFNNIKQVLDPAMNKVNSTIFGFEKFQLSSKSIPMTSWFAGHLLPGERSNADFTIVNPTNKEIIINITPEKLSLLKSNEYNGTTKLKQQDSILKKPGTFSPNYIKLADAQNHLTLDEYFDNEDASSIIPNNTSLMILNVNFPFNEFMNKTSNMYASDLKISSLYIYDWVDKNNNTRVTSNELSMINRAGSWGTVQELRVSEPHKKFNGVPLVGVYPVPTKFSYWLGDTKMDSIPMDYTLSTSYYTKEKWPIIWTESETITVPPKTSKIVSTTLVVPNELQTGVYQGFLKFEAKSHTVNAPVSFAVKQPINSDQDYTILVGNTIDNTNNVMYGNGYVKGAFDMGNRYMAGDWRQYYFDIQNDTITSAAIELSWQDADTNFAMFVMNPAGQIVQTNVPSGIFGHFQGWPSLDWLGSSVFSQGGGFYPVKNKDDTSSVLHVPINQTGTYTILAHSTLFGGDSTTESIELIARFLDIVPQNTVLHNNIDNINDNEIPSSDQYVPDSINNTNIEKFSINNSFEYGIIVGISFGIGVGVILGIMFFVILSKQIREKSNNIIIKKTAI